MLRYTPLIFLLALNTQSVLAEEEPDQTLYLQAHAAFDGEQYDDTIRRCQQLLQEYPDSKWRYKAVFLQADAHAQSRRFTEAAEVYEQEARRLLSTDRKSEMAAIYIRFAEFVSRKPGKNELDAPPPDYAKAHRLYELALSLEIPESLRDEVMFRLGRARQLAEEWSLAVQQYERYIGVFDPDSKQQPSGEMKSVSPGTHIMEAHLHLAECQLADGRPMESRITLEDLIIRWQKQGSTSDPSAQERILKDARYLLVQAYGLTQGASDHDFQRATRAAMNFLSTYPGDPRHVELNYQIGRAYEDRGLTEDALSAYRPFTRGEGIQLSDQNTPDGEPVRALFERLRMDATYRIGQLLFQQQHFDEAIQEWKRYVADFPNGPRWTDAQQQIISAEYEIGLTQLRKEQFDEAKATWDRFLTEHPLDPRCRQILFTYGALQMRDPNPTPEQLQAAISTWEQLVQKYPDTDESSYALFRIGQVYEEQLGDMEKALESYRKLTWGNWAGEARQRIAQMTQKQLEVVTERIFRTNESPFLTVRTRNIEKLNVSLYALGLEAYWRKRHAITGIEQLDIGLIDPDKTWEHKVDDYAKYRPYEQQIPIPMDGPGIYAVHIGESDLEATTLLICSDLELILKSSRREALVFVEDMLAGKPAAGARVLLSANGQLVAEGETNTDGIFQQPIPELKDSAELSAFVLHEGHVASNLVDLQGLGLTTGLKPRGYLYTDRPAYRPGQTVSIRGILRDVRQGSYMIPEQGTYRLRVVDAQGRAIHQQDLSLSEFGTIQTQLTLDAQAPVGEYRLQVRDAAEVGPTFTGTFQVQRFQLEKLSLSVDFSQPVYFRGETVKATFAAAYYYGQPLVDRAIRVQLPDGRSVTEATDEAGKISVEFDTMHYQPGSQLSFYASIEGEAVSVVGQAYLAALGYSIRVTPQSELVLAGEPMDVLIETRSPLDKPVGQELTLRVYRQVRSTRSPLLDAIPWFQTGSPDGIAEVEVESRAITTDAETGRVRTQITRAEGGSYIVRVQGEDRFSQPVTGEGRFMVSDQSDAMRLRIFTDRSHLRVGDQETVRIHSRLEPSLGLVTFEGEGILGYRVLELQGGYNDVTFGVEHAHFPNFHLSVSMIDVTGRKSRVQAFMSSGVSGVHEPLPPLTSVPLYSSTPQLLTAGKDFQVERQLRLTVQPGKEVYGPGEQAEFEINAQDQQGQPVRAELSLALVDQALYALFEEQMPSIQAFFEDGLHRDAAMRTTSSCTFRYAPATQATVTEWQEEAEREAYARKQAEQLSEVAAAGVRVLESMRLVDADTAAAELPQQGLGDMADNIAFGKEIARARAPVAAGRVSGTTRYYAGYAGQEKYADKLAASAGPTVREELLDAGIWLPAVTTDENGKAAVNFVMPQKTTEWRITARGCTVETLVGEIRDSVITRSEFFLDLKLPTILTEGDQLRPMVQVHNLTDFEGEVDVRLTWRTNASEEARKALTETVRLSPKGTAEIVFDALTIPAERNIGFEVSASADGDRLRDVLRKSVPIRPWGVEISDTKSRVVTGDETLFLELPALPGLTNRRLLIQIAPRMERLILELALGSYPIWRKEETAKKEGGKKGRFTSTLQPLTSSTPEPISRIILPPGDAGSDLLAVTAALGYLETVPGRTKDTAALLERGRMLVNTLIVRQRDDGGWSWSPGSKEVDPRISARNFWALASARQRGLTVPDTAYDKASTYLQTALSQTDDEEVRALILHALTRVGQGDFSVANRLYRNRQRLTPRAMAATALTFALLDRNQIAGELLDLILQDADPGKMETEVIALSLLTLQRTEPGSSQMQSLVDALMSRRRWGGFHPYEAKGAAVTALADYYRQTQFAANDYHLTINVNGETLQDVQVQASQPVFEVETDQVVEGANRIEFRVQGQARYAYRAVLEGFLNEIPDKIEPGTEIAQYLQQGDVTRHYYHAPLEYKGRQLTQSTSEITQLGYGERTAVSLLLGELPFDVPLVVVESLPAGTSLIPDSVAGNFQYYEVGDREIRFFLDRFWGASIQRNRSRKPWLSVRYELMSYAPGTFRVLPTRIYDVNAPDRRWVGPAGDLTVLARGEVSGDTYVMNNAERYELGKAYFDDSNYEKALPLLQELRQLAPNHNEREVAQMLLWISTEEGFFDAPRIVDTFEILRERFPELTIPFDKILVVGKAYREMNEMERAYLVFRSTLNASYANDSHVSAVLQDEGQFLNSITVQKSLWQQYPDTPEVVTSHFALSQTLYAQAPQAHALAKIKVLPLLETRDTGTEPGNLTSVILLRDTIEMLVEFLTLYPANPLADDATFSLANAYLDLEFFDKAIHLCGVAQERYPESDFLSSFQYVEALGLFSQHQFQKAIQAAQSVADGKSKDRDLARYILGQIYHALGEPQGAIRWYQLVREMYPDAAESINAFEARRISLAEVTRFRPGEPVSLTVKYRNIKEADLQVYRVDLMKLYLREKNLSQITQVRLEGISPEQSRLLKLGDGKDYTDKEQQVTLDITEEGAYLVICRGDDLFTSGLVLITPLEMEVQEDAVAGRVRANLHTGVAGAFPEDIHVKVVGSADQRFVSGETDLRGVFIADGIRGTATVLARNEQNQYAFYRGTQWLGTPKDQSKRVLDRAEGQDKKGVDFRQNLLLQNQALQGENVERFEQLRRGQQRGVEVQKAY